MGYVLFANPQGSAALAIDISLAQLRSLKPPILMWCMLSLQKVDVEFEQSEGSSSKTHIGTLTVLETGVWWLHHTRGSHQIAQV